MPQTQQSMYTHTTLSHTTFSHPTPLSPTHSGTCRAQGNYLPLDSALNLCLKPACAKTIQLNDFELASIKYDMSSIDPTKSTADLFHSSVCLMCVGSGG